MLRLLDLFCGAGGCARGYADVGFQVVGVDLAPQKHYPYEFHQADAMRVLQTLIDGGCWEGYTLKDFSMIHASPPCQEFSKTRQFRNIHRVVKIRPMLLEPVYRLLRVSGLPWVIENVEGAPMPDAIELCGCSFGLPLLRHRWFASSEMLFAPAHYAHPEGFFNVVGGSVRGYGCFSSKKTYVGKDGREKRREGTYRKQIGQLAMGIDWMTVKEMSEAVPPAYTRWIGAQLLQIVRAVA
jgi:DNA (cytosine-5)-methyltransferase 1